MKESEPEVLCADSTDLAGNPHFKLTFSGTWDRSPGQPEIVSQNHISSS
jgi:hypothetical protein